jgi:hypothetical protein
MKSYFNLMGGVPWVRYYHMFLAQNSTNSALYVNLDVFRRALDTLNEVMPTATVM